CVRGVDPVLNVVARRVVDRNLHVEVTGQCEAASGVAHGVDHHDEHRVRPRGDVAIGGALVQTHDQDGAPPATGVAVTCGGLAGRALRVHAGKHVYAGQTTD